MSDPRHPTEERRLFRNACLKARETVGAPGPSSPLTLDIEPRGSVGEAAVVDRAGMAFASSLAMEQGNTRAMGAPDRAIEDYRPIDKRGHTPQTFFAQQITSPTLRLHHPANFRKARTGSAVFGPIVKNKPTTTTRALAHLHFARHAKTVLAMTLRLQAART